MRRAAGIATTMTVVLALSACGLVRKRPDPPAPVVPPQLTTATWTRATDTMEVDLKILPDGRYRSVEIYSPAESGGVYQLQRVEDGVTQVSAEQLRLIGRSATLTRTAADDPDHNNTQSTPTRDGTYRWQLKDNRLHLVDANGDDAVFSQATQ